MNDHLPPDPALAELTRMLRGARRGVVFTGAGISTESGIPDFRSPGGIWTKMMPVQFQDYIADPEARRMSWERRFEMEETWNAVKPNAGHLAVAELVRRGHVSAVITQNIDNLHQVAGVAGRPSDRAARQHRLCQMPHLQRAGGNRRYPRFISTAMAMRPTASSAAASSRPPPSRSARPCRRRRWRGRSRPASLPICCWWPVPPWWSIRRPPFPLSGQAGRRPAGHP